MTIDPRGMDVRPYAPTGEAPITPKGSNDPSKDGTGVSRRGLLVSLGGIAVLLALHYTVSVRPFGIHDILRRLFYVPIVGAAIAYGLRGGLLASGTALLGYIPHLGRLVQAGVPALDPAMELVLLPTVGTLVGWFADSSRRDRVLARERGRLAALGEVALAMTSQTRAPLAAIEGQAESLRFLSERNGAGAVGFAARVISEEVARVQRFLTDLDGLGQGSTRLPSNIDLAALTTGVVADIQAKYGVPSRLALGSVSAGVSLRADARVVACTLRFLIRGLLEVVPAPQRLEVGVGPTAAGATVQIRAIHDGPCVPGLDPVGSESHGPDRDDRLLRQALSVHLLAAEGAEVEIHGHSHREALLTVRFRGQVADRSGLEGPRRRGEHGPSGRGGDHAGTTAC